MKAILKKIRNCIVLMIKGVAYDYDVNDKVIHVQYASGEESWYKYDDNGNMINLKFANGSEWWYEYDVNYHRPKGSGLLFVSTDQLWVFPASRGRTGDSRRRGVPPAQLCVTSRSIECSLLHECPYPP